MQTDTVVKIQNIHEKIEEKIRDSNKKMANTDKNIIVEPAELNENETELFEDLAKKFDSNKDV